MEDYKRSEERIILDCISDGVITIDLEKRIKYINKAMRKLLGYEDENLIGKSLACELLVHSNICTTHDCVLEKALGLREKVSNYETVIRDRDGRSVPVSINTDFLRDEAGHLIGIVEVFRDISLIKKMEEKLEEKNSFRGIVGKTKRMQEIFALLKVVANSKTSVLLEGESGTGKELIARAIHANSSRREKPFIIVSGAALAEGVLESELFGHVKGAFTGALYDRLGRFELADKGTIFLDEIGDISLSTQAKLLRVLQEETFERVGDTKPKKVDVRVIAATNKDLTAAVRRGRFREDLYYRIRVFPITLPPLRERMDDIPLLIDHFIQKFNSETGKHINNISPKALEVLLTYGYPGNVRELENIIEHAFVCCSSNTILVEHFPKDIYHRSGSEQLKEANGSLDDWEKVLIVKTLEQTGWKYTEASHRLGISRSTLWRKVRKFGLRKAPAFSSTDPLT